MAIVGLLWGLMWAILPQPHEEGQKDVAPSHHSEVLQHSTFPFGIPKAQAEHPGANMLQTWWPQNSPPRSFLPCSCPAKERLHGTFAAVVAGIWAAWPFGEQGPLLSWHAVHRKFYQQQPAFLASVLDKPSAFCPSQSHWGTLPVWGYEGNTP